MLFLAVFGPFKVLYEPEMFVAIVHEMSHELYAIQISYRVLLSEKLPKNLKTSKSNWIPRW